MSLSAGASKDIWTAHKEQLKNRIDMQATLPRQASKRSETPDRLNIPADRLQKEMEWIGQERDVPPQVANAIAATLWLLQVDAFREQEEEFMLSGEYEANLPDHRAMLSEIIATGEKVVF